MVQDTLYQLYSKSDKFWLAFMRGDRIGRKLYLWNFFRSYFDKFYQLTTNLFSYEGIEKQLAREIERRLFYFGQAGVIMHEGKLAAVNVSTFEPDIYGRPEQFTFSFLNGAKDDKQYRRVINEDGILAINTYERRPTSLLAEHYALLIAHCDTSIQAYLVNTRIEDVLKAGTEKEAETARSYLNKVYNGEQAEILDKLEEIEVLRRSGVGIKGAEYLDIKDPLLKDSYNTFGINRFEEKKERVVVDEVNANAGMLRLNLVEMLEMRENLCEDIYKLWGVDARVSPLVDIDGDSYIEGNAEGGADNV